MVQEGLKMSIDKLKNKVLGRRQILKSVGLGALALAGTGLSSKAALATPDKASEYLSKLTSGAAGTNGKVTVKLPEIAENGRTVQKT
jgi:sulfur-oxidizing protein SoxY